MRLLTAVSLVRVQLRELSTRGRQRKPAVQEERGPHGQAVKTSPFHGGNTSSNLVGVIKPTIKYGAVAKW